MIATLHVVVAHGLGGRSDLPLPTWLFTYAAGMAVVISFVAVGTFWRQPHLAQGPAPITTMPRATGWLWIVRGAGRLIGLALFALTLAVAWVGPPNGNNLALVMVFVAFWVGLPLLSAVAGDIWQVLSPWDTVALVVTRLRGRPSDASPLPQASHWWAVAGLFGFTWLELCYHNPSSPRVLASLISVYAGAMVLGAAVFGRRWLRTGDAFAAWFGIVASLAPLYRDPTTGRVRARLPFTGAAAIAVRPGTVALVLVALGSTGFDSTSNASWWEEVVGARTGWDATWVNTLGLMWVIGVMALIYAGAMRLNARIVGEDDLDSLLRPFIHSLVPIALAYVLAHYFSLLVFEGQQVPILVSDPFARGWDLFGTIDWTVNYLVVSTRTISLVQVGAIVAGHVAGVVLAHDRAIGRFPRHLATRAQLPLLVAMVFYTVGGLVLLLRA